MADYGQIGGAFLEVVVEIPALGSGSGKIGGAFLEIVVESPTTPSPGVAMATSLNGKVKVTFNLVESKNNDLVAQSTGPINFEDVLSLVHGTSANQADLVWSDSGSVASGTPVTVDLRGSLTSILDGGAVSFVEVVGLYIKNKSTTTSQNLQIGGGSNPWITHLGASGDVIVLGPGGRLLLESPLDGYAVTAGTGDILQIASSSGTISYDVVIYGRSA